MAISSASRYFLFFFRFPFLLSAFVFNAAARANFFLCGFFGVSPPVGPSPTAFRALRLNEPFSQFCILPREAFLRGGLPSLRDFGFLSLSRPSSVSLPLSPSLSFLLLLRDIPKDRHSGVIFSPSSSLAIKRIRSSMILHSFQGIRETLPNTKSVTYVSGMKCYLCLRKLNHHMTIIFLIMTFHYPQSCN